MKIRLGRNLMFGTVVTLVLVAIAAALLAAGGIVAWEYSNSDAFCTNMCHAVHPEEPKAHAASFHARVNCVECHMGRMSTLQLMAIKPTHIGELWGMIVGYERPTKLRGERGRLVPAGIAEHRGIEGLLLFVDNSQVSNKRL